MKRTDSPPLSPPKRGLKRCEAFTLVEIMIVVLVIGILLAIAVPNYANAREQTRRKACIGNLRKIQWAKDAWLMDNRLDATETPTPADLWPNSGIGYIKHEPLCPSSGTYEINNGITNPTCSQAAQGHLVNGG